jgi:hypothetical protein
MDSDFHKSDSKSNGNDDDLDYASTDVDAARMNTVRGRLRRTRRSERRRMLLRGVAESDASGQSPLEGSGP